MRDQDIRKPLVAYLDAKLAAEAPVLIVEEVPVCGQHSRIDLAVIGEGLWGYEIKSPLDSLGRLVRQFHDYALIFNELTLVIGVNHLGGVLSELPSWCGILLAQKSQGQVKFEVFRDPRPNLHRDPLLLAKLLWRNEALEALDLVGRARGVRSKPRQAIWERIAESLTLDEISAAVCLAMKRRPTSWRCDERLDKASRKRPWGRRRRRRVRCRQAS